MFQNVTQKSWHISTMDNGYIYLVDNQLFGGQFLKYGWTDNPHERLKGFNGSPFPFTYHKLFRITKVPQHILCTEHDNVIKTMLKRKKGKYNLRQFYQGGSTEYITGDFSEVPKIMINEGYELREVTLDDVPKQDRSKSNGASRKSIAKMMGIDDEQSQPSTSQHYTQRDTLKEIYLQDVMKGRAFRQVQDDLWTLFEGMCQQSDIVKGIVQWPTGVGKTVAITSMLYLARHYHFVTKPNKPFRALVISPKNDILETTLSTYTALEQFGLKVLTGFGGQLSSIDIPSNESFILLATHQGLVCCGQNKEQPYIYNLTDIDFVLYDEVHRITGDQLFKALNDLVPKWQTKYLLGTSATPLTSNAEQHIKFHDLFGSPPNIIHRCEYVDAINKGWIAKPRFNVYMTNKQDDTKAFIMGMWSYIDTIITKRKQCEQWKYGKIIWYFPSSLKALSNALSVLLSLHLPNVKFYVANVELIDKVNQKYVSDAATFKHTQGGDGNTHILLACQKFREGSDIQGIEMNAVCIGETIEPYILIQIVGRALRTDYEGKIGDCCILKTINKVTQTKQTPNDVLYEIFKRLTIDYGICPLEQEDEIKATDAKTITKHNVQKIVDMLLGDVTVDFETQSKTFDKEEASEILQKMYVRELIETNPKLKYQAVRALNQEYGFQSREHYMKSEDTHMSFVKDPEATFKDKWISWYHFLGVDTSNFPQTKEEFVKYCKKHDIRNNRSYEVHYNKNNIALPQDPFHMYKNFTNWSQELSDDDDLIW